LTDFEFCALFAKRQIFAPTQKFATITKDRQRAKYINEADFDGKIYCIW